LRGRPGLDQQAGRAFRRPHGRRGSAQGAPADRTRCRGPLPRRARPGGHGPAARPGRPADPAVLRAHGRAAGPGRRGHRRRRVRPDLAVRRGRRPDLAADLGWLAGAVRPGRRGAPRRADDLAQGAGPPVPVRELSGAAGSAAPGRGAAADRPAMARSRGRCGAGRPAGAGAGRLRRRGLETAAAGARVGPPAAGSTAADGHRRCPDLARGRALDRPVRAARRCVLRRLALTGLLVAPPAVTWLRSHSRLDPVRFTLAYLADEAAYGAGVCRGAWRERTAAPLLPLLAWGGGPGRVSGPRPSLRATLRSSAASWPRSARLSDAAIRSSCCLVTSPTWASRSLPPRVR